MLHGRSVLSFLQPHCRLIYAHYCRPWRWNTGGQGIHKCSFFFTYCSSPSSGLELHCIQWTQGPGDPNWHAQNVYVQQFSAFLQHQITLTAPTLPILFTDWLTLLMLFWPDVTRTLQNHCTVSLISGLDYELELWMDYGIFVCRWHNCTLCQSSEEPPMLQVRLLAMCRMCHW